jgi:release factor glutamine methyltransferase
MYTCPVCGYPDLNEAPRMRGGGGSCEICYSCGFEYGVTDEDSGYSYDDWRGRWVRLGLPWTSAGIDPAPRGWDPVAQLASVADPARFGLTLGSAPDVATDDIVGQLRAAGCVFAEDEARLIVQAGGDTERLVARRVAGEPLEYVLGFVDFAGLRVSLDPGVFIPRQRSEFLVRHAVTLAPPTNATVLDLCCGSGALGLALAHRTIATELHAADLDPVAVRCAERNLRGLGDVHEGDLFEPVPRDLRGRVHLLLANVPYVATADLDTMPIEARDHEPASTHDGGDDGLDVARRVLAEAGNWLSPGGRLFIEIAEHQIAAATAAFAAAGFAVHIESDDELGATIAVGRAAQ